MKDRAIALAAELLECFCAQLAESPAGRVCSCCLVHSGTVPAAEGCDCDCEGDASIAAGQGHAWVRVAQVAAVAPVGTKPIGCRHGRWTVLFELGSRRCVATIDEGGVGPDCQALTDEAVMLAGDAAAARAVVRCCAALEEADMPSVVQQPIGPAGGCAGWISLLQVTVRECGCVSARKA